MVSLEDSSSKPVRQPERLFPRSRGERRRAEAVPVVQAEEARRVRRKVGTPPHGGGQRRFEGLPREPPEPVPFEAAEKARVRSRERRETGRGAFSRAASPPPKAP